MRGWIVSGDVLLMLIGGCRLQRQLRLAAWGVRTTGTVKDVYRVDGRAAHASVRYTFWDSKSIQRTGTDRLAHSWQRPSDGSVQVVYLSDCPDISAITGSFPTFGVFLLVVGAAAVGGDYWRVLRSRHDGTQQADERDGHSPNLP